jgi:hypothetical protein
LTLFLIQFSGMKKMVQVVVCKVSFVFVEELSDRSDVDAIGYEGAFESETTFGAEVALKVGAVHALALLAVFHAEVKSIGRLGHVHRHGQPNQERHQGHGRHFLSAQMSCYPSTFWMMMLLGKTRRGSIHFYLQLGFLVAWSKWRKQKSVKIK